jgi:Zn-dependent peptidase ImmA (M78 family)
MQTARVPVQEMRGFSIAEWPYPVIALNGGDAPRGRLFTLLHELAHLAVSSGGLCDLHQARGHAERREDGMERYCNEVAAAALMPSGTFLADRAVKTADRAHRWGLDELHEVSRRFGPSPEAVLLRLVALERTSWPLYRRTKAEIDAAFARAAARERERRRAAHGGPSFYVVRVRDLGRSYVDAVLDAFYAKSISSLDVADYLDIRFDQLPKLERALSA